MGAELVATTKTPTILAMKTLLPKRNIAAPVARTRGIEAKAREVTNVVHEWIASRGGVRFGSLSGNVPCMTTPPLLIWAHQRRKAILSKLDSRDLRPGDMVFRIPG
jgi:hypothetical protein